MYYEQIQLHHHENGPSTIGEPSHGQALPGVKKPHTPYTIEEILKPTAPRPRAPSPCGLLVDGVCTCGLTGNVVSTAFYVDVQQQFMCSQQHRFWKHFYFVLFIIIIYLLSLCSQETPPSKKFVSIHIYSIHTLYVLKQFKTIYINCYCESVYLYVCGVCVRVCK